MFSLLAFTSFFAILQLFLVDGELLSVIIVSRHGARSPTRFYSIDKYSNLQYWPEGPTELTNIGRRELYELGQRLRTHYRTFIEPHNFIKSKDIQAVSTDTNRSLESANILLAGLYPPNRQQQWNTEYNWSPVPVRTTEVLGNMCGKCPHVIVEVDQATKNLESNRQYQKYVHDVSKHDLKGELKSFTDYMSLLDNVVSEKKEGYRTVDWLDKYTTGENERFLFNLKSTLLKSTKSIRLCSGPLMQEIVSKLNETTNGGTFSKIFLYSGHEGTLRGIMRVINVTLNESPDFGSTIIFEIHRNGSNNYIKMMYNHNALQTIPKELEIPNCGYNCPFNEFVEIVKPFIPVDWKRECYNGRIGNINEDDRLEEVSGGKVEKSSILFYVLLFVMSMLMS